MRILILLFLFILNTSVFSQEFDTKTDSPFGLSNLSLSAPTFVDIDNDNDFDAFANTGSGVLYYHENIGTASNPNFTTKTDNPFGLSNATLTAPTFVDIDNDGDFDAFANTGSGVLYYHENIGTASNPNFTTKTDNPFGLSNATLTAPTFVDIDNDGDYDAFANTGSGVLYYHENIGTASNPNFTTKTDNPFGLSNPTLSAPTFVDIDRDNDYDAFANTGSGVIYYHENIGTASNPNFTTKTDNPFGLSNATLTAPTFVDIDNDGDFDAFANTGSGVIYYQENIEDPSNIKLIQNIEFYPNPVFNYLFLDGNSIYENYIIYDIPGKVLMNGILEQQKLNIIDFSKYHSGIYFVKIISRDNKFRKGIKIYKY